jgi:parallel beta-helix repeat protein
MIGERRATVLLLMILCVTLVAFPNVEIVKAESIYIGSDGIVEGTDKIQQEGNVYTLTDNINGSILVEKDSIILDGAGYTLQGTGSGKGIFLFNCHNVTVTNIEVRNFDFGIHITARASYAKSYNHTISGTTITANKLKGIYISWSSNNILVGNNISYNEDYGIALSGSNNLLRNNIMNNNKYNFGVTSDSVNNDIDRSNTVNGKPICYWFDVQDRTVPSDAGYVALINCKNITVQNLQLSHNGEGIGLYQSSRNLISGNYIANNGRGLGLVFWDGRGIGVTDSFNNQIIGNNITKNNGYAIRFTGSQRDNVFYHNNFIDNKVHEGLQVSIDKVYGLGLGNEWDNGEEGNYWSDYATRYPNATKVDSSGVGDTPYVINENNQDNYPLMNPADINTNQKFSTIPEFPSWTPLLIALVAIVAVIVIFRHKLRKQEEA